MKLNLFLNIAIFLAVHIIVIDCHSNERGNPNCKLMSILNRGLKRFKPKHLEKLVNDLLSNKIVKKYLNI